LKNENKIIFLLDDNASNLTMGRNVLSGTYTVYTCNSGVRLFKLLEKIRPHLILLDVEMPDMDGFEVMCRLRGNWNTADIPVIFLTAHDNEESEIRGRTLGVRDYIIKPFSPELLLERIETHLGSVCGRGLHPFS